MTRTCLVGPRREDRQLALRGWFLASRDRRVEERDVRAFRFHEGRDALDPGDADRAHLHPDRARRESRKHALVASDRHDGVGVGHHRDDDRRSPRGVGRGVGDFRAEVGKVSGRFRLAVPHDRRDAGAQRWSPSRDPSCRYRAPQSAAFVPSLPPLEVTNRVISG